jgi:hypothetical protein
MVRISPLGSHYFAKAMRSRRDAEPQRFLSKFGLCHRETSANGRPSHPGMIRIHGRSPLCAPASLRESALPNSAPVQLSHLEALRERIQDLE